MSETRGAAGRLAGAFVNSKLTPLFIIASIALGLLAVLALPREEEPQIIVPMIDVFVQMPGASAAEVEQRVTRPMEKLLWEVPGVEYVYSTSSPGLSMVIVRFLVGEQEEAALVRLNQKLAANADRVPPGVIGPLVKLRSIDDVPILAVTLWGPGVDDHQLRLLAGQLHDAIKEVPDVSEVTILGGRPRHVRVDLDPARLAASGIDPLAVRDAVRAANVRLSTSSPASGGEVAVLQAGGQLRSASDVRNVVVAAHGGRPLLVRDVATVVNHGVGDVAMRRAVAVERPSVRRIGVSASTAESPASS
jgi:multidrug efflux pump subunit AcrB